MHVRALVTGGAGFIGSFLIPELLARGFEVVVFDLAAEPAALDAVRKDITYVRGDLGSAADLYRVMLAHDITDIFHLGSVLAGPCEADPLLGFRINFGSTQTLLDAAVARKINRFLMISSISVFGRDAAEPVADDAVKNPETVYGQTKLACEHLLRWYNRKHGLDTRALRFTWVFGPGRTTGITALYSSAILDAVARGVPMTIPNPDECGDWLYVKDAVKAILCLYDARDPRQRIYNIAGGAHTIREVVALARGIKPEAVLQLAENGTNQSPYPSSYDDAPARRDLGWSPDYEIERAVHEHIAIVSGRQPSGAAGN
jgi:nucleoside-diphosphate-sugar epimerase